MSNVKLFCDQNGLPFMSIDIERLFYTRRHQTGIQLVATDNTNVFVNVTGDIDSLYCEIVKDMQKIEEQKQKEAK